MLLPNLYGSEKPVVVDPMIFILLLFHTNYAFLMWILRFSWQKLRRWRNITYQYCYLLITADAMTSYHSREATLERHSGHW